MVQFGGASLPISLTLVETSRCDVPAREAAGGIVAPLKRGADGAARRPYQVQGFNARNFSEKPFHEPPPSPRPSPPPRGRGCPKGGEGGGSWSPMRGWKTVGTTHKPSGARLRRALTSIPWRSGRSLAPPFMPTFADLNRQMLQGAGQALVLRERIVELR